MTTKQLIAEARQIAVMQDSENGCAIGGVGCAILTKSGKLYKGVSIDCACAVGCCAEHSAIAAMVTERESQIERIVAVSTQGQILPPCGRCRELMYQINKLNLDANIIVSEAENVTLRQLLPLPWQDRL